MNKTIITTALLLMLFSTMYAQNGRLTTDEGVMINGIRWATRNVDAPGTFAPTPENFGMFYQYNRRKGWRTPEEDTERWNNTNPTYTTWYAENDPCPEGWRVPTDRELESLRLAGSVRTDVNGVDGRLFGTYPYQIFLPAVGVRFRGGVHSIGMGVYLSSCRNGDRNVWVMQFNDMNANAWQTLRSRNDGFSVRCVVRNENDPIVNAPPPPPPFIRDVDRENILVSNYIRPIRFTINGVEQSESARLMNIQARSTRGNSYTVRLFYANTQPPFSFSIGNIEECERTIKGDLRGAGLSGTFTKDIGVRMVTLTIVSEDFINSGGIPAGTYEITFQVPQHNQVFLSVGEVWGFHLTFEGDSRELACPFTAIEADNWTFDVYPRRGLTFIEGWKVMSHWSANVFFAEGGEEFIEEWRFDGEEYRFRADRVGIYTLFFDNRKTNERRIFRVVVE